MKTQMKPQEKGLLLIYLRNILPFSDTISSFDTILSYRHDMTNIFLSCNFKELIEIPIYENDSFLQLKIDVFIENTEINMLQKLTFEEIGLESNSLKSFSLDLNSENQRFFLIFDAFFKSSLTGNQNQDNNILKVKVQELKNLELFLKKRAMVNREKQILKKNISDFKYFVEFRYFAQKFALELCEEEVKNLNLREFFFIYDQKDSTHPFTIEVIECEYEKLTPEDDLTFIGSLILDNFEKPLVEVLNTEFILEDVMHRLIISFQTSTETSNYLSKMPTYSGFKLLSGTFFDSSLKDAHLLIYCQNSNISWLLKPLQTEFANEKTNFIWNSQHSLINSKALSGLNDSENKAEKIDKEELKKKKIVILNSVNPMVRFEALLLKYRYLEKYDKILENEELKFMNKINETLFINEIPYENVIFELYDSISKEKKGVCQVCLMDLEENTLNLEFLLDPKLNIVVGTISFLIEFQGNQSKNENFYKMIDTKQMLNYDDFNKFNYLRILSNNHEYYGEMERNTRKFRGNYFTKTTKMVKFHIEIEEIWNCFELYSIPGIVYQDGNFSLICKIANYSYVIPFLYLTIKLEKIKTDLPNIYKSLIHESQMQVIEKKPSNNVETMLVNIYFLSENPEEVIMLSFEKNTNFWVIVENPFVSFSLQIQQRNNILMFYKGFMKELLIFKEKGVFVLGMEVKNTKKLNTQMFNTNNVFVKFSYEIKEDLDYSKENFCCEGLYQILLIKDEKLVKKETLKELNDLNYEIEIKDQENNEVMKQALKFQGNFEGTLLQTMYEIKKSGGFGLNLQIYRLFSEEDEEYQLNSILNNLHTKSKSLFSSKILLNFLDIDQSKTNQSMINILPNSYCILEFLIPDEKISIKTKDIKKSIEFPLHLIISYKCNTLIENFTGNLIIEIPESTLKYYLGNGYAKTSSSLKFNTISSGSKQTRIFNFKGQNEINGSNIALNIKKYTQIIIVQLLNPDKSILDSDSIKISDLLFYFDDKTTYKHTLLFNNKPFIVSMRFNKGLFDEKNPSETKSKELSKKGENKSNKGDIGNNIDEKTKGRKKVLSELDQIKLKIHNLKNENSTLSTQLIREQKNIVLKNKTVEDLEIIIQRNEINSQSSNVKKNSTPLDQTKINKAKELFYSICACGAENPIYRGYCEKCLTKMKDEYKKIIDEYTPLREKLENLSLKNMNHLSKMAQINKKIDSLKLKIKNFELDNVDNEEKFLKDDLNHYKEKKILLEAEIELINKKYEKILTNKQNEQKELENKLLLKSEKLQKLDEETEMYIQKIKDMKEELIKMSEKLLNDDKTKSSPKKN